MEQRTNLIIKNRPIKYILGSLFLLALSGFGILCLIKNWEKYNETVDVIESQVTITPIIATPSIKLFESFESINDGFLVEYDSKRKLLTENEESGKRYIFSNPLGNITVHAGKSWSWIVSDRIFTDKELVGEEKSYVYEITNQKVVDVEKGEMKYTIQCVHNTKKELKAECEKFLEAFKFI